ncbi:unnamed protein product [Mesocestoides corti]|uniref:Uncharacterized protein n=1 Tax=Mesocestoides corti TaxID=53468 RepID=A0A0R3UCY7_MESCO|nr:unnamed protein product [Mesocestoides corti]
MAVRRVGVVLGLTDEECRGEEEDKKQARPAPIHSNRDMMTRHQPWCCPLTRMRKIVKGLEHLASHRHGCGDGDPEEDLRKDRERFRLNGVVMSSIVGRPDR